MTLRLMDGFDTYTSIAQAAARGWSNSGGGSTTGRFGGLGTNSGNGWWRFLPSSYQTVVAGVACKLSGPGSVVLALLDSGTYQFYVQITGSGALQVVRGDGTILATSTSGLIAGGVWFYLEAKVKIHGSTGTYAIRLNGGAVPGLPDATAQNTQNSANASVNEIGFGPGASGNQVIDDLYVCDTAGSVNNDFLGDVKIEAIFPNGDGNSSQWVGSDSNSINNSLLVDEATPNDDTDYVASSTSGNKDTYAMGNLTTAAGTVLAVQPAAWARKDDAGNRLIVNVARLSGVEVDSTLPFALGASYGFCAEIRETKPGGGAWSLSDVNAAEFGVKVV